jgi:hypothetical protein
MGVNAASRGGNASFVSPKRSSGGFVFGSPIGKFALPSGSNAPPTGNFSPPFGIYAPPSGSFAPPPGNVAPPPGNVAPPPGNVAPPIGVYAPPNGNVAPPPPLNFPFPGFGGPASNTVSMQSSHLLGSPSASAAQFQSQNFQAPQSAFVHQDAAPLPVQSLEKLSEMLRSKGANPKPWELASAMRPKPVADDFVPGFKRITMFALIEQAKAKAVARRADGGSVPHLQKDVVWPKMTAFNKQAFLKCRAKFYECVLQSLMSGVFSSFKECVVGAARSAAMRKFHLTEELYLELDDKILVEWFTILFGPKHKAQALAALAEI